MYVKKLTVLCLATVVLLGGCVHSRVVHRTHRERHRDTKVVWLRDRATPRLIKEAGEKRHGDAKPPRHKVANKRSQPERPREQGRQRKVQGPRGHNREEKGKAGRDKRTKDTKKGTRPRDAKQKKKGNGKSSPRRHEGHEG